MVEIRRTEAFGRWLSSLRDMKGRARIEARLARAAFGYLGDVASVGEGVLEMRIHSGPGYRVYFTMRSGTLIVLLAGGDKSSQRSEIRLAIRLRKEL
jgi:putative addiction module killer protein